MISKYVVSCKDDLTMMWDNESGSIFYIKYAYFLSRYVLSQ